MSAVGDPELGQHSSASDGGRWTKRAKGGPVKRQKGGDVRTHDIPGVPWYDNPREHETVVTDETGGIPGAVWRMGYGRPQSAQQVTQERLGLTPQQFRERYGRQEGGPVYASDLLPYIRLAMEAPRDPYARDPYMHAGEAPGGGRPSSGSLPNPWLGEDVPTRMPLTAAEREGLFPRGPAGPEPPYYGRATPQSPYRPSQYEPEGYYPPPAARAPAARAAEPDIIDLEPRGGGVYGEAPAPRAQRAAPRPRSQPARKRTMVLPGQYPKGLEFKRKGGAVGPPKGKHAAHLVIMIGVMKHRPGAISEKAAKKRGLDAVRK